MNQRAALREGKMSEENATASAAVSAAASGDVDGTRGHNADRGLEEECRREEEEADPPRLRRDMYLPP